MEIQNQLKSLENLTSNTTVLKDSNLVNLESFKRKPISIPETLVAIAFEIGSEKALQMFQTPLARIDRNRTEGKFRAELLKELSNTEVGKISSTLQVSYAVDSVMKQAFRTSILGGARVDGRQQKELRELSGAIGILPVLHGSSFFQRGDTHVLCTTTLGSRVDSKKFIPITGGPEITQNFFLHYDFPPYCTGETGSVTASNRRIIGHGNLAEKAIRPVMPSLDTFPYACRVFAESTSSNGSTSMASVCAASLSLMDAGVPLKAAVAGLSIGLVSREGTESLKYTTENQPSIICNHNNDNHINEQDWVLLTDILGTEDHYGDMDFKIAGTSSGVTAIQLDIKLENGIPLIILEKAIDRASEARQNILSYMKTVVAKPRMSLKENAPRAEVVTFNPDKLRHLVGPGGEMVKYIEKTFQCEVNTSEEGVAYIYGQDERNILGAKLLVQDLVLEILEGSIYSAEVIDVKDFGATVKLTRAQEALLHLSELSHDLNVIRRPINELLAVGQVIKVKVVIF
jgi:polyribonucleotide nucleotidyltransferase